MFEGAPRFHEFVLELPSDAAETNEALLARKIIGGLPLREVVSGAGAECEPVVRDRDDDARADGCGGGCAAGGCASGGDGESLMDISAIEGEELKSVAFVEDFLELRFGAPVLTLYDWPYVLLTDFSVGYGEPEYRNALCAQIGETVAKASLEEDDALTIELGNGVVFGLSLREEDVDGPESGMYSESGFRGGCAGVLRRALWMVPDSLVAWHGYSPS